MTDKTKISKERSLIFSKRFNKWLEYDGWNTLTGKDDLKDVCDELDMTRAEAENLVKENTIAQVFRDALDEILNETDEDLEEYGDMAHRFYGEEDDKYNEWYINKINNQ